MTPETKSNTLKDVFFKKAPIVVLMKVYDKSPTFTQQIWRDTNITLTSINNILETFQEFGVVNRTKKAGRTRYIKITEKGKKVAKMIMSLHCLKKDINNTT